MTPLISEVLAKVAKAKTKEQKVKILRDHDTAPLRMILKSSFDPSIEWELPEGDVPYVKNDAPEGTEHTNLTHESRLLFHFIKGLSDAVVKEAFGWTEEYMQPDSSDIIPGHEQRF